MRREFNEPRISFYIGDVRDINSVKEAMIGIDYVFSAAALKQVPTCEFFPMEAVATNVIGANNVLDAAIHSEVKRVVCLSTDKAAYPINAMGLSKAMMEKIVMAKARSSLGMTGFSITRYGNVMASRGSVIPLFISQLKSGNPITVTDPQMTRFMMNLDDSVDLVLFALKGKGLSGDLYVQKSPAATIMVLAEAIKSLFDPKASIKIIGPRHGEKTHETLLTREEMVNAEDLGSYYRVPLDDRGLNYERYGNGNREISKTEEYTSAGTTQLGVEEMVELLKTVSYIQDELSGKQGILT